MLHEAWKKWYRENKTALRSGKKLPVPTHLPRPSEAGFTTTMLAEPAGQELDWVCACQDESRIHVHQFADGSLLAHVDEIDPGRGVVPAIKHGVKESDWVKTALWIASAAAAVAAVLLLGSKGGGGR